VLNGRVPWSALCGGIFLKWGYARHGYPNRNTSQIKACKAPESHIIKQGVYCCFIGAIELLNIVKSVAFSPSSARLCVLIQFEVFMRRNCTSRPRLCFNCHQQACSIDSPHILPLIRFQHALARLQYRNHTHLQCRPNTHSKF